MYYIGYASGLIMIAAIVAMILTIVINAMYGFGYCLAASMNYATKKISSGVEGFFKRFEGFFEEKRVYNQFQFDYSYKG